MKSIGNITFLILSGLVLSSLFSCATGERKIEPSHSQPEKSEAQAQKIRTFTFNKESKLVSENNNVPTAIEMTGYLNPDSLWQTADSVTADQITKQPFNFIGSPVLLFARIYRIEQLPPSKMTGQWNQIFASAPNRNASLGSTTIEYLYNGDISNLNSGNRILLSGYMVGMDEGTNAMGGPIEAIVVVGNACKRLKPLVESN